MLRFCKVSLLAAAFVILGAASALAVPITYTYSGTGSGTIGTATFSNAAFVITALADTANIGTWCCSNLQNTHLTTTINITGVGTFTITTASHTWIAEGCCAGLGANLSNNWVTLSEPALNNVGYNLATNIGPILETSPQHVNQFNNVATTGGTLNFQSINTITFQASTKVAGPDCKANGTGPDCQGAPPTLVSRPGITFRPQLSFTEQRECPGESVKVAVGVWQVCSNRR